MNILNLTQGSNEWHQVRATHFTASEASAMLGISKYKSRDELLKQKATGEVKEVTAQQQKIFDKGHQYEEQARPFAESIIGEELFPATATAEVEGLPLLASFDGITMLEDVLWEHKTLNKLLAEAIPANEAPDENWPQLEHQLLVAGADKVIFMASEGTEESAVYMTYESVPERRARLIAGWKQFAEDLSTYEVPPEVETVEAEPVRDLPAISYKMDGLALTSNIDVYKSAVVELVERSKKPLETEQDFANAESMIKVFKDAESKLNTMAEQVLGEVQDIDAFTKDLKFIGEQIRQARLATDKQVKARKEEIKKDIVNAGKQELDAHFDKLNSELAPYQLPSFNDGFSEAIKGKRTLESMTNAVNTAVANAKIHASEVAQGMRENIDLYDEKAQGFNFLFTDLERHLTLEPTQLESLIDGRIAQYKTQEQERIEREQAEQAQREAQERQALEAQAETQSAPDEEEKHAAPLLNTNRIPALEDDEAEYDCADWPNNHNQAKQAAPKDYTPLALWPSDADRADNDELDRICIQLEEAEAFIELLKAQRKAA